MTILKAFAVSVSLLTGAAYAATPAVQPPTSLTDEGACPFECCTYREWSVKADTPLLEKPADGSKIVGKALKGTRIQGLTGTVIVTTPGQIEVLRPHTGAFGKEYKAGDTVWVYTERGEGYFKVWHRGEMYDEEAGFMCHDMGCWDRCVEEGTCWGQRITFPKSLWWVKVRTKEGVVGWSKSHENFGDMDACD
jgi:hypothetical protein